MVAGSAAASALPAPSLHWSLVERVPDQTGEKPVNVIEVNAEDVLLWNGLPVTEDEVRTYLGLVMQMASANLTVLKSDPQTPRATLGRIRQMMQDVLNCDSGSCAEVVN